MSIVFILLLLLIVLPLWLWLVSRIWQVSTPLARATFFLIVPAYLWAGKHWDDREIALRPALVANLLAFFILALVGYKAFESGIQSLLFDADHVQEKRHAQTPSRSSAEWARWCKEENDATYDPALGTCVENGKEEALARSDNTHLFERLAEQLRQDGISGEFDESQSAAAQLSQWLTPEIAKLASYYFLPLSMSQPQIAVLLCVSEAACEKYEENARERGMGSLARNKNLLLILPENGKEDTRLQGLESAFVRFKV